MPISQNTRWQKAETESSTPVLGLVTLTFWFPIQQQVCVCSKALVTHSGRNMMVAHVLLQHKPDTLMILLRAVVWPWLACSGTLISNNNRISWQVAYKQHSFILTWLVCHTLCRSLCLHLKLLCFCSHSCVICLFVTSFPSFFFSFWLLPLIERNAMRWKGAFCSCKICKSCLSLSAFFFFFFFDAKAFFFFSFLLVCHCGMVITYLFFFCQLSIQARIK